MIGRMPIACQKNGETVSLESTNVGQQNGNDLISAADAEGAAGEKIVLNVGNQQGIVGCEGYHESMKYDPAIT